MNLRICTPLYKPDGAHKKMVASVATLCAAGADWQVCVGPHIWRNRNSLIDLQSSVTHYLFWDSDVSCKRPKEALARLLSHAVGIVGGAYQMRRADTKRTLCAGINGSHLSMESKGLHPVDWVGAGLMLVRADVFATCSRPWFRHEFVGDDQTPEDIGFCMHARRNGIECYVDCDVAAQHHL